MEYNQQEPNTSIISPMPIDQPVPGQNTPMPTKNKRKKLVVIGTLVLAVSVLVALAGYFYLASQKTVDEPKSSSSVTNPQEPTQNPQQSKLVVIEKDSDIESAVRQSLSKKYKVVTDLPRGEKVPAGTVAISKLESKPAYKVPGYDFYINDPEGGTALSISTSDPAMEQLPDDIYSTLKSVLTDRAFEKIDVSEASSSYEYYANKTVVCSVSPSTYSSISCGLIEQYKKISSEAAPVIAAVRAARPELSANNVYGWLGAEDSTVPGYKRAYFGGVNKGLDGPGGPGLALYQKAGGPWVYFTATMQMSPCSAYNTVDLRNAFKGTKCEGPAPGYGTQIL